MSRYGNDLCLYVIFVIEINSRKLKPKNLVQLFNPRFRIYLHSFILNFYSSRKCNENKWFFFFFYFVYFIFLVRLHKFKNSFVSSVDQSDNRPNINKLKNDVKFEQTICEYLITHHPATANTETCFYIVEKD